MAFDRNGSSWPTAMMAVMTIGVRTAQGASAEVASGPAPCSSKQSLIRSSCGTSPASHLMDEFLPGAAALCLPLSLCSETPL